MKTVDLLSKLIGIVRDILLCILISLVLLFGVTLLKGARNAGQGSDQSPATVSQLPPDRCGGGVC
jgi:hypothetical protein